MYQLNLDFGDDHEPVDSLPGERKYVFTLEFPILYEGEPDDATAADLFHAIRAQVDRLEDRQVGDEAPEVIRFLWEMAHGG